MITYQVKVTSHNYVKASKNNMMVSSYKVKMVTYKSETITLTRKLKILKLNFFFFAMRFWRNCHNYWKLPEDQQSA